MKQYLIAKIKRLVFAAMAIITLTSGARAQGIFTFTASPASTPIRYSTDGFNVFNWPVGNPATVPAFGQLNIGLFAAPNGTVLTLNAIDLPNFTSAWTPVGTIISLIQPLPGAVPGINITLPPQVGAPGVPVEVEVVGWTGTAISWSQALFQGGELAYSGQPFSGGALGWSQPTGTTLVPQVIVSGPNGFQGLMFGVPEPSTMAIAGLSFAVLALSQLRELPRKSGNKLKKASS